MIEAYLKAMGFLSIKNKRNIPYFKQPGLIYFPLDDECTDPVFSGPPEHDLGAAWSWSGNPFPTQLGTVKLC